MFQKIIKSENASFWFLTLCVLFFSEIGEAQTSMRLELEKETQKKVSLAITEFVFKGDGSDVKGLGKEAKSILEKDLNLSELFSLLAKPVFEELERIQGTRARVDYRSWRQIGAQWLIKTEYRMLPKGRRQVLTFRL